MAVKTKPKKRYSAPALEKGLEILEFLSTTREALSLSQVCEALDRSKGEIFRMIVALEERGYLMREEGTEKYVVTDKMFRVAFNRPPVRGLIDVALPIMHALAEEARYPCHLVVRSETQVVTIARAEGPDLLGVAVRIGYRRPLLETGSGLCLLAFMSEQQRKRTVELISKEGPPPDAEKLKRSIEAVQRRGYVARRSPLIKGVTDLCCPVFDGNPDGAVASMAIPRAEIAMNPIPIEKMIGALCRAARQASEELTHSLAP